MTTLLAYLRERPWLCPCLEIMVIGVRAAATSRFGYPGLWFGVVSVAGALLMALVATLDVSGSEPDVATVRMRDRANPQT